MARRMITEDEMLLLIEEQRRHRDLISFGFGPSGVWIASDPQPAWLDQALKDLRERN